MAPSVSRMRMFGYEAWNRSKLMIPVIEPDDIKGVAGENLIPEAARDTRSRFSGNGP